MLVWCHYVLFTRFYPVTLFCVDEKPFVPKKFTKKSLRVHNSFRGKGTAKEVNCPNPLKDLRPLYLLCAISVNGILIYTISDTPVNTEMFNTFIWKLSERIKVTGRRQYFLFDNATFHELEDVVFDHLDEKGIAITRTPALGCFCNPIEEFFGHVHQAFTYLLHQRLIDEDASLSMTEFKMLIHAAVQMANAQCNFKILYQRAGIF